MKSRIFIGSSIESKEIAEKVQNLLEPEFECVVWTKNFFDLMKSTYNNLVQKAPSFDYAVFIGGPDDKVIRWQKGGSNEKLAPRDNVYLEFALYGGILSPARSFFMLDESCEESSDLKGITLLYFDNQDNSIEQCCEKLKTRIREEQKINRIRLLPSTSLAIGYYYNFIDPLLKCMAEDEKKIYIYIEGKRIKIKNIKRKFLFTFKKEKFRFRVNVVIPSDVETDWKVWEQSYAEENGFKNAAVESKSRPMAFMVDVKKWKQEKVFEIIDVPQTLRVAFQAVEMTMGKDFIGDNELLIKTKQKEVANFVNTLKNLMKKSSYAQKYVVIREQSSNYYKV